MADFAFEQQLRNELQSKFELKPNNKKRKSSFNEPTSKKQKLSHNKSKSLKSKQSMIKELKELGLVNNNNSNYRSSLPPRNNTWKQQQNNRSSIKHNNKNKNKNTNHKKHKIDNINDYNTHRPTKRRKINIKNPPINNHKCNELKQFTQLHNDITIYPFKPHLWYNLAEILSKDDTLCGYRMNKKRFLELNNNNNTQIFLFAKDLYNSFCERDTIKNEFHLFTLSKGTFRDRISTMILRINEFHLTRLNHLDTILNMLSINIKRQSIHIIPLISNLFIDKIKGILPNHQHLNEFNYNLNNNKTDITQMDLILYYFEHLLKQKYILFIELLENYSSNSHIEKLKYLSNLSLYKLLLNKSENELLLLNLLINKFGETDNDISKQIIEYLYKISIKHPMIKPNIIYEINNYIIRPLISPKGLYNCIIFLNKLKFTSLETEASSLLCGIYMDLFKQLISYEQIFDILHRTTNTKHNKNNNQSTLDCDNIIFKTIFDNEKTFTNDSKKLNKINKFNTIKNNEFKIMKKLVIMTRKKRNKYFKTHAKELIIWKRFLLFEDITPKLLSYILQGITYVFPYANLNLKIFKNDLDYIYKLILASNIKIAFMALQFTFNVESTYEIGISGSNITDKTPTQIVKYGKNRQELYKQNINKPSDRFYQILYLIISRWDFIIYNKPNIVFNLIYKCIKYDTNKIRIISFIRRLIQFCLYGNISFICGALYLFSQCIKIHPFLSNMFEIIIETDKEYNLNEFEPKLSNANILPFWELNILLYHIHPIVRDFTKQLIVNKNIIYDGDILNDFKRKVLFEKFTQIMAHKMKEFKPKNNKNINNNEIIINSHLSGDGFIAIYKHKYNYKNIKNIKKENKKTKLEYESDEEGEELDENNQSDEILADEAMFNWLKSYYGSEIPDDKNVNDEEYDYSELKQEIIDNENKNKLLLEKDEDSDIDLYVSDDDDNDNMNDIPDMPEHSDDDDDMEKKILFEEIKNQNIILPNDVEYASNEEEMSDDDNDNDDHLEFLKEEDEDEDDDMDDDGDFFEQDGFSAGQLNVN